MGVGLGLGVGVASSQRSSIDKNPHSAMSPGHALIMAAAAAAAAAVTAAKAVEKLPGDPSDKRDECRV